MTATRSVRLGADLLDREIPNWHRDVDPDLIDMRSWDNCVLGQVGAARAWWIADVEERWLHVASELNVGIIATRRYGFWSFTPLGTRALERAWVKTVTYRRQLDEIVITRHPRTPVTTTPTREKVLT